MSEEVRKSVEARVLELQKQCELGNKRVCLKLGKMYQNDDGVKQDYQKAIELYKKACDLGEEKGCQNYQRCLKELEKEKN